MEYMCVRVTSLDTSWVGSQIDAEVWDQLRGLEAQISELKLMYITQKASENQNDEYTALVGGLQTIGNTESANKWMEAKTWDLNWPQPAEVYSQGKFRGIVFIRFESRADSDAAAKFLRKAFLTDGGDDI